MTYPIYYQFHIFHYKSSQHTQWPCRKWQSIIFSWISCCYFYNLFFYRICKFNWFMFMYFRYYSFYTFFIEYVNPFSDVVIMMVCNLSYFWYSIFLIFFSRMILARYPDSGSSSNNKWRVFLSFSVILLRYVSLTTSMG